MDRGPGFYRGTEEEQMSFFADKERQLIASKKWPAEFTKKVDMNKVSLEVMRTWISKRVTELLGIEDEIVIDFCMEQLSQKDGQDATTVCPKRLQVSMTGFMNKKAAIFVKELWNLLLSAQENTTGIPQQLLEEQQVKKKAKEMELEKLKREMEAAKKLREEEESKKRRITQSASPDRDKSEGFSKKRSRHHDSPSCYKRYGQRGPSVEFKKKNWKSVSRSPRNFNYRNRYSPKKRWYHDSPGKRRRYESPGRRRYESPGRRRYESPGRRRYESPGRRRYESPGRRRYESPRRRRNESPRRRRNESPERRRNDSLERERYDVSPSFSEKQNGKLQCDLRRDEDSQKQKEVEIKLVDYNDAMDDRKEELDKDFDGPAYNLDEKKEEREPEKQLASCNDDKDEDVDIDMFQETSSKNLEQKQEIFMEEKSGNSSKMTQETKEERRLQDRRNNRSFGDSKLDVMKENRNIDEKMEYKREDEFRHRYDRNYRYDDKRFIDEEIMYRDARKARGSERRYKDDRSNRLRSKERETEVKSRDASPDKINEKMQRAAESPTRSKRNKELSHQNPKSPKKIREDSNGREDIRFRRISKELEKIGDTHAKYESASSRHKIMSPETKVDGSEKEVPDSGYVVMRESYKTEKASENREKQDSEKKHYSNDEKSKLHVTHTMHADWEVVAPRVIRDKRLDNIDYADKGAHEINRKKDLNGSEELSNGHLGEIHVERAKSSLKSDKSDYDDRLHLQSELLRMRALKALKGKIEK